MRTPAGTECPHYFADYHRGRSRQACRLLEANPRSRPWTPDLCNRCRVPRIVMANACPNLRLEAQVVSGFLGLGRRVEITARCVRSGRAAPEPEIGCGLCHLPNLNSPAEGPSR